MLGSSVTPFQRRRSPPTTSLLARVSARNRYQTISAARRPPAIGWTGSRRRGGWDSGPAEGSSEGAGSSSRVIRASAPAWEMASSLTPPAAWRSLSVLGWSSTLPSSPGAVVNFPPRSTPGCTRWGPPRYPSERAFSEGSGQHDEVVAVDDLVGVPVGEVA